MRRALAALLTLAALLAVPAVAMAQQCPRTSLADIEDEVMCPVCGTPLGLATEAPQAQRERAFIEDLIAECRTKEQIKRALVAEFGEGVLALPGDEAGEDDTGDVLVYAIPALALLLGAAGIALAAARWRRGDRGSIESSRPEPDVDAGSRKLDADMERYEL